jgi:hypothetical protein
VSLALSSLPTSTQNCHELVGADVGAEPTSLSQHDHDLVGTGREELGELLVDGHIPPR